MKPNPSDSLFPEMLAEKIREGMIEGIRREVQRRRDARLPIHIARNGHVENIGSESASKPDPKA